MANKTPQETQLHPIIACKTCSHASKPLTASEKRLWCAYWTRLVKAVSHCPRWAKSRKTAGRT